MLKRCIYGVDLNPMAVELAKVSLWLDCFTLDAPLSFLDHHMKAGNSLIGGSVQEVQDALSRDLFGHQFAGLLSATQLMRRVGELSDVTTQEVAESRKAYKGAYDALAPFKRLLDVWLSEAPVPAESPESIPSPSVQPERPKKLGSAQVIRLLDEVTGINVRIGEIVVAEVGTVVDRFPTEAHLASWVGLCPAAKISANKRLST